MPVKQNLWLSSPLSLSSFLDAATEADKWSFVSPCAEDLDMTTCGWVKVGTVEFSPDFSAQGLKEKAAEATDIAIDALTKTFQSKLEVLEAFKQTLLCLEAPKTEATRNDS